MAPGRPGGTVSSLSGDLSVSSVRVTPPPHAATPARSAAHERPSPSPPPHTVCRGSRPSQSSQVSWVRWRGAMMRRRRLHVVSRAVHDPLSCCLDLPSGKCLISADTKCDVKCSATSPRGESVTNGKTHLASRLALRPKPIARTAGLEGPRPRRTVVVSGGTAGRPYPRRMAAAVGRPVARRRRG